MALRDRITALVPRPRLPRRTVRLRLTLIYSGLFLLSGVVLLATTYLLVRHALGTGLFAQGPNGGAIFGPSSGIGRQVLHGSGLTSQKLHQQAAQLHAQAIRQNDTELHELVVNSAVALGAMFVVSLVLGWVVAGRILRPLRTITKAAQRISATNLDDRLSLGGPDDELKELGATFDELLERLEAAFQSQRAFVANASHELRSPIARQRTVGQVALRDPNANAPSLRAVIERILDAGRQQERLIDALLTLSRGQAGLERRETLDLAMIVQHVVRSCELGAEVHAVALEARLSPAPMAGDPRLVERLVTNLIDNALRYNVDHGRIDIETAAEGDGTVVLSVTNTGPVVPEEAVDRLRQPFQRMGPERTNEGTGVGLGLSIVDAITIAHRGTMTIRPLTGGGLEVNVRLPGVTDLTRDLRDEGDAQAHTSKQMDFSSKASRVPLTRSLRSG